MNEKKPWYQSKTVWGLGVMMVSAGLQTFGIDVDLSSAEDGIQSVGELFTLLGAALTAIGIRTADRPLGLGAS